MKGTILSIDIDGSQYMANIEGPPTLERLQAAIGGGYIEVVPYFTKLERDGKVVDCVVFCDEEGKLKGLKPNYAATAYWQDSLKRQGRSLFGSDRKLLDFLVGKIAIVWGDQAFMRAL